MTSVFAYKSSATPSEGLFRDAYPAIHIWSAGVIFALATAARHAGSAAESVGDNIIRQTKLEHRRRLDSMRRTFSESVPVCACVAKHPKSRV